MVEFYDNQKDPIKNYFMEKIQMMVSNKKVIEVLSNAPKNLSVINK